MSRARKLIAFGGTFSVALGIGFVMQNGDALAARFGSDTPASAAPAPLEAVTPVVATAPEGSAASDVPFVVIQAGATPTALVAPAPAPAAPEPQLAAVEVDPVPAAPAVVADVDCLPSMTATPGASAMVTLALSAPCHPGHAATIHHSGMVFSILTGPDGMAQVSVPALSTDAVFLADMGDNVGAAAMVMVPEAAQFDRAVLQWQGASGLDIHAREFGAAYGSEGHVWSGAPRDPSVAAGGQEGFLTVLGEASVPMPMMAEVYSFPTGGATMGGVVDLSVEAQVSTGNCGRQISAQSLQFAAGQTPSALDLTMSLPDCDAVGEILVLSNMLQDLTLASR